MDNIFYYYGIVYLLHYVKALYDVLTFNKKWVKDKADELIPDKITKENAVENKNKLVENLKKSFSELLFTLLIGICNWAWIIAGALYAMEENSFGILFIISALSVLITIIYSVNIVIKNRKEIFKVGAVNTKQGIQSLTDKVSETKILNVIDRLSRIAIAGFILYQHFYSTT